MGIPSYFSYIVKNHSNIIKKLTKNSLKINNLYMDCNSIIYDVIYNIDFSSIKVSDKDAIIYQVIKKIEEYIYLINPDNNIFIAFDGVAPVAKLQQQRERRFKSLYQNKIMKSIYKKQDAWNTSAITPGTSFMDELNKKINYHFNNAKAYHVNKIIISTSEEYGEGEHKLFQYIRSYPDDHKEKNTVIYGLDADLIMLSINHLPISNNIYLFRETPHFIKTINSELEPNETYLLDIPELSKIITDDMNNNLISNVNRIYDYIFLCFLLGNDFMPHFPSINIRTGGIDKLLNAYKITLGASKEVLTDGKKIYWKNIRLLIKHLSELEEEYFKTEMKLRDKREKFYYPTDTSENIFKKFDSIPTYERAIEKKINPFKEDWETRYYQTLFHVEIDDIRKKQICFNYLEGLEWTMKYYTIGCPDWRWSYKYNYPPLLKDLIHYIPYFETEFIPLKNPNPVSPLVQLSYVLPRDSLSFIPEKLYNALLIKKDEWYPRECEFTWAFCKYFWESHVDLPDINIEELENFIESNKNL
jgi:5'-3' exonuclease